MEELIKRAVDLVTDAYKNAQNTITPEMYENERKKRFLNLLLSNIDSKRIKLDIVAYETGKDYNFCAKEIPLRVFGKNTSVRWAVDVIRFVCTLWHIPTPPKLLEYERVNN